jgi:predicted phage terminase large subunit-like protein
MSRALEKTIDRRKIRALFAKYPADVVEAGLAKLKERLAASRTQTDQTRENRARALNDFEFFCQHYFPSYFEIPDGPAQKELKAVVAQFINKKDRKPLKKSRAMPRGYGKSTILSLCAVLWLMLRGEWQFVVMVSSSRDSAKRLLNSIIQECEDNQVLLDDFPELTPAIDIKGQKVSWTDYDVAFSGGFRVIAKGFLNAVRGARYKQFRPSALVIDDPDEEKDISSDSKMRRKYQWLDRAALKLGSQWGIDVLLSYTTISPNCVGEHVHTSDKYRGWDRKKWKAIEVNGANKEYSTWPQGAPLEVLQAERDSDAITFAQERQNEPLGEVDQKFKGLIQVYEFESQPASYWNGWTIALACDLSLGRTEKSDFSAIQITGMNPEGKFLDLYSDIKRRRPDIIERDLIAAAVQFPLTVLGIEENANQEYFLLNFRRIVAEYNRTADRKIICPIVGIPNTADKEARIVGALQPLVAAGNLVLRSDSKTLFRQLEEFPYNYKDGPDALEMSVRLLKSHNTFHFERIEAV